MKSFRLTVLFCMTLAAWAVFAQQGSMHQPAQSPQMPGAASQNPQMQNPQNPQSPQPGIARTPGQGPAQSPETQSPQGASSQAPAVRSGGSGADAQVNAL